MRDYFQQGMAEALEKFASRASTRDLLKKMGPAAQAIYDKQKNVKPSQGPHPMSLLHDTFQSYYPTALEKHPGWQNHTLGKVLDDTKTRTLPIGHAELRSKVLPNIEQLADTPGASALSHANLPKGVRNEPKLLQRVGDQAESMWRSAERWNARFPPKGPSKSPIGAAIGGVLGLGAGLINERRKSIEEREYLKGGAKGALGGALTGGAIGHFS